MAPILVNAQDINKKLQAAVKQFEADTQIRHAIYSLYIIDSKNGSVVFEKNAQIGLAPASTQKLFTSGAAFDLLGNGYRFKTELGYKGKIENGNLAGYLYIKGSGDPTLGSWRFEEMKEDTIIKYWVDQIKKSKIRKANAIWLFQNEWSSQTLPDGWIWQDIGNYYGAGSGRINWRENQYDLVLKSGLTIGAPVQIVRTIPELVNVKLISEVLSAEKGSGDNAYIYLPPKTGNRTVRGTIPLGENSFVISGSFSNPGLQMIAAFKKELERNSIKVVSVIEDSVDLRSIGPKPELLAEVYSPPLDSINFWFLRRSINLYGEALIKAIAHEKTGLGSTEKGVELVKKFWAEQGIDQAAINITDGSGLSPQNRVTTNALVRVLQYAKTRPWYNSFYTSLPTYNGMKMKSGSIGGARSFAGYHTSKDGNEYIFAIIVNNYDGSSSAMVRKMYQLLDNLK